MKHLYEKKVLNHQVDHQDLTRAPQDARSFIRTEAWRDHACCGDYRQEGCLMKNKVGELKVGVCDIAPKIFFTGLNLQWCPAARGDAILNCGQTWKGLTTRPLPLGLRRRRTPDGSVCDGRSWTYVWAGLPFALLVPASPRSLYYILATARPGQAPPWDRARWRW